MDTQQERLSHLDHALSNGENICSSEGMLCSFPASLKKPFMINGAGLMVCRQGNFTFSLNMKVFSAQVRRNSFHSGRFPLPSAERIGRPATIHIHLPDRTDKGHHRQFSGNHVPIHAAPDRTMLRMEHRRRRRSSEIHVLTGQYPALRQQHLQRQRTKAASAGTHIPHLFHLQP